MLLMDLTQEVEQVKKELLELIIEHLKQNKIEAGEAQQLARDFLAILPIKDQADLLEKLKILGSKYKEANEIYLGKLEETTNDSADKALTQVRDQISHGNINGAIETAKNLTEIKTIED